MEEEVLRLDAMLEQKHEENKQLKQTIEGLLNDKNNNEIHKKATQQ